MQRGIVAFGRQYQPANGVRKRVARVHIAQPILRQLRAALFIVRGAGIIDSVVKPDGQFNGSWIGRKLLGPVKLSQAVFNVQKPPELPTPSDPPEKECGVPVCFPTAGRSGQRSETSCPCP